MVDITTKQYFHLVGSWATRLHCRAAGLQGFSVGQLGYKGFTVWRLGYKGFTVGQLGYKAPVKVQLR